MDKVIEQLKTIIKLEEYLYYELDDYEINISPSIIKEYYNEILKN
tara:strand:+ start:4289 stop:4423 length:135 start_codon:yes stop_codon:yes gene_type:complete